jgi:hypothetical protein
MLEAERCYRVLDLEPGASPEEIHQGYLDLVWVWHPDRFVGHPRLQQKAQTKLQELNEAHERLRAFRTAPCSQRLRPQYKTRTSSCPNRQYSRACQSPRERLDKFPVNREARSVRTSPVKDFRRTVSSRNFDDWLD